MHTNKPILRINNSDFCIVSENLRVSYRRSKGLIHSSIPSVDKNPVG